MNTSSLILIVCAGLLLSGGGILGGSAGWSILRMSYYFWTSDLGMELSAGIQLVVGAILCLPVCWLATIMTSHQHSMALQATLMFLSSAAMMVLCTGLVSLGTLSNVIHSPARLNASMHNALAQAQYELVYRNALDSMQMELHCCGVESYDDWFKYRPTLPAACCNRWTSGKMRDVCEVAVFTSGCLRPAMQELRAYVNAMAILTSIIIITLAVTLFATTYTLVLNEMERGKLRKLKTAPMRVACLHAPAQLVSLVPPFAPPAPPAPLM